MCLPTVTPGTDVAHRGGTTAGKYAINQVSEGAHYGDTGENISCGVGSDVGFHWYFSLVGLIVNRQYGEPTVNVA